VKKMKNKKYVVYSLIIIASLLFVLSCKQIIGLGPKVDMTGPTLRLIKPENMKEVSQENDLVLEGTVKDDTGILELTVSIEDLGLFFKYEQNAWFKKNGNSWETYSKGKWNEEKDGLIKWSLNIALPEADAIAKPNDAGQYLVRFLQKTYPKMFHQIRHNKLLLYLTQLHLVL